MEDKLRNIASTIDRINNSEDLTGTEDILDRQHCISEKKHRNITSRFNHWFDIISHPFAIFVFTALVVIVFLTTRYMDNATAQKISDDSGLALTYLVTVIISSVLTNAFNKRLK